MIFQTPTLDGPCLEVLEKIEQLKRRVGSVIQQPRRWDGFLRRNLLAKAIRGSNTIEGYNVTADDAVAAVLGEEPTEASVETWNEIRGYRSAMTYVFQLAGDQGPVSCDLIRALHYMMLQHDLSKNPGQWRPGDIFVKREDPETDPVIVYAGPDAGLVPGLMAELCQSINESGDQDLTVRGAMSHLNLTMIHPFRDGNGRMARCLQTLVLAKGGHLAPAFVSIEEYLGSRRNTDGYYRVLADVGQGSWHPENNALPWVRFCLTAHFRQISTVLDRMNRIEMLWDGMEKELRLRGLPERAVFALVDAAWGYKVKNASYRINAEVSMVVATRDLLTLAKHNLLVPEGAKRGRFYVASPLLLELRRKHEPPKRPVEDPFDQLRLDFGGSA